MIAHLSTCQLYPGYIQWIGYAESSQVLHIAVLRNHYIQLTYIQWIDFKEIHQKICNSAMSKSRKYYQANLNCGYINWRSARPSLPPQNDVFLCSWVIRSEPSRYSAEVVIVNKLHRGYLVHGSRDALSEHMLQERSWRMHVWLSLPGLFLERRDVLEEVKPAHIFTGFSWRQYWGEASPNTELSFGSICSKRIPRWDRDCDP